MSASVSDQFADICTTPFWDQNTTWDTTSPALTPCFVHTALTWAPSALLWAMTPYTLWDYLSSGRPPISPNRHNTLRLLTAIALIALGIAQLVYSSAIERLEDAELIATIVSLITYILLAILLHLQRRHGYVNSGPAWFYLAFQLVCSACSIPTWRQFSGMFASGKLGLTYAEFGVQVALFLLCSVSDRVPNLRELMASDTLYGKEDGDFDFSGIDAMSRKELKVKTRRICPKEMASFPSKLTFAWFDRLVWTGYRRPLTLDDLWQIRLADRSRRMFNRFNQLWGHRPFGEEAEKDPKSSQNPNRSNGFPPISIVRLMAAQFWPFFLWPSLARLVTDNLQLANPTVMKYMIEFTSHPNAPLWQGIFYTLIFVIVNVFTSLTSAYHQYRMSVLGMRIRACLLGSVYRKSLVLSQLSRRSYTTGEVVNLMAVDSQRFLDMLPWLCFLWTAPVQVAIALWLLWNELGISVLGGLAMMIAFIPINGYIAGVVKGIQGRQMALKDKRLKAINEMLNGIKVLKLYAWEQAFIDNIQAIRVRELNLIRKAGYISTVFNVISACSPFLVSCVTFAIYILSDKDHVLTATKAFVSIAYFNLLRIPLTMIPNMISNLIITTVSVKRLNKFLNSEESEQYVTREPDAVNAITLSEASFIWERPIESNESSAKGEPKDTKEKEKEKSTKNGHSNLSTTHNLSPNCTLTNLSLSIPRGSLVAVVGAVGSGKSSLLSALLGEMQRVQSGTKNPKGLSHSDKKGRVNIAGDLQLAYVPQQAWIQNATVRDNITFGKDFTEKHYRKVVDCCALTPDLEMLTAGDQTEIGEKGINLSGGQKQRVSIARACYADADLYLFDDPLSAVDSHVGRHIFEQVLSSDHGLLAGKTRVLVTNALYMLSSVDQIVLLKHGEIEAIGSYDHLMNHSQTFSDLILNYSKTAATSEEPEVKEMKEILAEEAKNPLELEPVEVENEQVEMIEDFQGDIPTPIGSLSKRKTVVFRERRHSSVTSLRSQASLANISEEQKPLTQSTGSKTAKTTPTPTASPDAAVSKLVQAESVETGRVTWAVYMRFFRAISLLWTVSTVANYFLITAASTGSSFWLNTWTADEDTSKAGFYLGIYFVLGCAQAVFVVTGWFSVVTGTVRASRTLHWRLLGAIVHAPMHFFDTTPLGRIVNRFSKDFDVLDTFIQLILRVLLNTTFTVLAAIFTVTYSTPIFGVVVIPFLILYILIQRFYVATSRQLKRIESVTRSPILTHFSETVQGVSTIKAYRAADRFMAEFDRRVDTNQRCFFPSAMANCWLQVRLEFLANILIFFASLFVALSRDSLSGGDTGLSLSYALNITLSLNMCVRMLTELENQVVSVERISEYTEIQPEADWFRPEKDNKLPDEWPTNGVIEFAGYGTRYRPGLDLVLKKVDISTRKGEKIGIVGRTGAGKSSLTLALFRIIEAANGQIRMDGVDIGQLGLQTLRSRITIIPQDPVLFAGTIRSNLDPFDRSSDEQLWRVLELSHLKQFVSGLELGLAHPVAEAGENLSVGQRQLICLARALLRKTRILVLDEATAAVDLETDALIQATIRAQFSDCTVLTIAHRLNTILDSDRVMVLDAGAVAEFDSPANLLADRGSIFHSLARDAGIV